MTLPTVNTTTNKLILLRNLQSKDSESKAAASLEEEIANAKVSEYSAVHLCLCTAVMHIVRGNCVT